MRRNNKGFSYVELILVMAIMAIMIGVVTISVGTVSRANINRGAEKLESHLERARSNSMARGTDRGTFVLKCENGGYYAYIGDPASADQTRELLVSAGSVTVGYYVNNGSDMVTLGSGDQLTIRYKASTGSFEPIAPDSDEYCTSIVLMNGDKSRTVILHTATGKCTLQ